MKQVGWEFFQQNITEYFPWKKGSRVAVLLEPLGYREEKWEMMHRELALHYEWKYIEEEYKDEDGREKQSGQLGKERSDQRFQNRIEMLSQWKPDGILGMGSFSYLQKVYWLRDHGSNGDVPLLLLSDGDRWQELCRDTLWIRGGDGRTFAWGYCKKNERDLLVLPEDRKQSEEQGQWWDRTETKRRQSGTTDLFCERDVRGRTLVEELAEPLKILLDIPMIVGSYYALLYLYPLLTGEQRRGLWKIVAEEMLMQICSGKEGEKRWKTLSGQVEKEHADWWLEKTVQTVCPEAVRGVVIPEESVPMLTEMAMEGIENVPPEQQLGWQQVERFYRWF